jgi:hypothetical protein
MPDQAQAFPNPRVECTGRSYRWMAVSGRREQEPSFFTVVAEPVAGDGGDDQGGEELQPVASSTAIRRVGRG